MTANTRQQRLQSSSAPVLRAVFPRGSGPRGDLPGALATLLAAMSTCMSGCGVSGSGPFGDSRGEVYSDCSSMWSSDKTLTIYTWWRTDADALDCETRGGEACAARSLQHTYEECANGNVDLVSMPSKTEALVQLEVNAGPADGGIVNGRADVCRLVGEDVSKPGLADLGTPDAPVLPFLAERTPSALRNLVSCGGHQFGAILGLHRVNQLFYNTQITQRPDIEAELSQRGLNLTAAQGLQLDDLTRLLETMVELGFERPLLLSNDSTTWSRFLVENLMVAVSEALAVGSNNPVDAYTDFWSELAKDTHDEGNFVNMFTFDQALERFESLSGYIQYVAVDANESVLHVLNAHSSSAVFTVTGDWEQPNMPSNVAVRPFPGTEKAYVYTADVVVAMPTKEPLSEAHPMATWFKAVTSAQAQSAYREYKHSLDVVTLVNGRSQSKQEQQLFTIDGTTLRGYQGLPAYIPHRTFDHLGSSIQRYMTCLVSNGSESGSPEACVAMRGELRNYVYDQYCSIITGSQTGCSERRPQWAQAQ